MGPYCHYCNHRCFAYIPGDLPQSLLSKYGAATITATCSDGQRFEREHLGVSYADIVEWRRATSPEPRALEVVL